MHDVIEKCPEQKAKLFFISGSPILCHQAFAVEEQQGRHDDVHQEAEIDEGKHAAEKEIRAGDIGKAQGLNTERQDK